MHSVIMCTRRLFVFAFISSLLLFSIACDSGSSSKKKTAANDKLIVAGFTYNGSTNDWWIKLFSPDGIEDTANWNKIIDSGNGPDAVNSLAVDSINNIYAAGCGTGADDFNDWWLKKFSADGTEDTTNWNKTFVTGDSQVPYDVVIDSDDNIYVVGIGTDSSNIDWWLKKFSADGTEDTANWNKLIDGSAHGTDYAFTAAIVR